MCFIKHLGTTTAKVKTQNTQSAMICLNMNFGVGGYSPKVKTQNTETANICLNLNFRGGVGVFFQSQNSKYQDLPKFSFSGGGEGEGTVGTKSQNRVIWNFWTKFPTTPACLCITDSLSHTTYVETNEGTHYLSVLCLFRFCRIQSFEIYYTTSFAWGEKSIFPPSVHEMSYPCTHVQTVSLFSQLFITTTSQTSAVFSNVVSFSFSQDKLTLVA